MKQPNSCVNLKKAINRLALGRDDPIRLGRAMAAVVVGQMLPNGVVKGGSALMFRYGGKATRYTRDVDTARKDGEEDYLASLERNLKAGWCGFTGRIVPVEPAEPKGVPPRYVMKPFDIKLNYLGGPWQTVRIEVGHNEIGDAEAADLAEASDMADMFESIGLPRPKAIPVMRVSFQIAQKLHALTEAGSNRVHDLVDLQLIAAHEQLDFADIADVCKRLFDYRRAQKWPPVVKLGNDWESLYSAAVAPITEKEAILSTAEEARDWANELIEKIRAVVPL